MLAYAPSSSTFWVLSVLELPLAIIEDEGCKFPLAIFVPILFSPTFGDLVVEKWGGSLRVSLAAIGCIDFDALPFEKDGGRTLLLLSFASAVELLSILLEVERPCRIAM